MSYFNSNDYVIDHPTPPSDNEMTTVIVRPTDVNDYLNFSLDEPQFLGKFEENMYGKMDISMVVPSDL